MAQYFITGASGAVGREVVQALLEQGHTVKAASRHPEKSSQQFGNQVDAVEFDFENPATYAQVAGCDGVFVLGPPLNLDLFNLVRPFIEYLEANGPQRIVYLSANGMQQLEALPFHQQMEEHLKQSNLDWRIVRPGFFMQNFANYERENIEQRNIVFVPAGEGKTAFVSTRDIGAAVAALLQSEVHRHQIFHLTGPELLSFFEAAALLSEVLGRPIVYPNPDEATYRQVLADAQAPAFVADYMVPIYGLIKDHQIANQTQDIEQLTGCAPETLQTVLERDFA